MKTRLLWLFLLPVTFLFGAAAVKLSQLQGTPAVSILTTDGTGKVRQVAVGSGLTLANNVLSATGGGVPTVLVAEVSSTTPNSYPIPPGRTLCIVSRNIPQALGHDYTIVNGSVVFSPAPEPGDIVQLICF